MLLLGHYREKRKKSTKADKKRKSDEVYGDSCNDEEFLKHSSKKAGYYC